MTVALAWYGHCESVGRVSGDIYTTVPEFIIPEIGWQHAGILVQGPATLQALPISLQSASPNGGDLDVARGSINARYRGREGRDTEIGRLRQNVSELSVGRAPNWWMQGVAYSRLEATITGH